LLTVKQVRVLIADSDKLIRSGVRAFLTNIPEVQSVIEANTGPQALQLIERHQPDLILLDVALLQPDGLEAIARIVKQFPLLRVIILASEATGEYARQAVSAGAAGFLLKSMTRAEFEAAVVSVVRGQGYVSRSEVTHPIESRRLGGERGNSLESLTARQRQILQLIAEGQSTKKIALSLNISVKTVETHRAQLMDRLNIHDVVGLVRFAIKQGLIRVDEEWFPSLSDPGAHQDE
jgi:DNA-binding NarL/FixJ family response regulator